MTADTSIEAWGAVGPSDDVTFTLTLRTRAMTCAKPELRELLRHAADDFEAALKEAYVNPTEHNLMVLNGAFIFAYRVLKNVPPEAQPTPPVTEEMRLAA